MLNGCWWWVVDIVAYLMMREGFGGRSEVVSSCTGVELGGITWSHTQRLGRVDTAWMA